jgi:hypothetical protein
VRPCHPFLRLRTIACLLAAIATAFAGTGVTRPTGDPWRRHTIDDSFLGPDGVRLADFNRDGLPDIATPWEQGGTVMVYLNPGPSRARERWPKVMAGKTGDPEDAVPVDLDGDGALDVVSASEGTTRSVFIHWGPKDPARLLDESAWETVPLGDSARRTRWMFTLPLQIDGRGGIDLVAGSKRQGAAIGWFESPADPRDAAAWKWHPLYQAGWVMTLTAHDVNGDGLPDIVATDREGRGRGALWLEHPAPGKDPRQPWNVHRIGPVDEHEAMHFTIADLDGDRLDDVIVAVKGGPLRFHRRLRRNPVEWQTHLIEMPDNTGSGKAVAASDLNGDGRLDLVVTCEHATDGREGVFWLAAPADPTTTRWPAKSISGSEGFIFDLVQLVDLDGDSDLDVLTVEEKGPYLAAGYVGRELGVIWYENPSR